MSPYSVILIRESTRHTYDPHQYVFEGHLDCPNNCGERYLWLISENAPPSLKELTQKRERAKVIMRQDCPLHDAHEEIAL